MDIQKRLDKIDAISVRQIKNNSITHMSDMSLEGCKKFRLACKAIVYNHGEACRRASAEYLDSGGQ